MKKKLKLGFQRRKKVEKFKRLTPTHKHSVTQLMVHEIYKHTKGITIIKFNISTRSQQLKKVKKKKNVLNYKHHHNNKVIAHVASTNSHNSTI